MNPKRILEEKSNKKLIEKYKDLYEKMTLAFHPTSQEIYKRTVDPYILSDFEVKYGYE